jgi:hypothetical protein
MLEWSRWCILHCVLHHPKQLQLPRALWKPRGAQAPHGGASRLCWGQGECGASPGHGQQHSLRQAWLCNNAIKLRRLPMSLGLALTKHTEKMVLGAGM